MSETENIESPNAPAEPETMVPPAPAVTPMPDHNDPQASEVAPEAPEPETADDEEGDTSSEDEDEDDGGEPEE